MITNPLHHTIQYILQHQGSPSPSSAMEVEKRKKKMKNNNNNKRVTRETDCERIQEKKMKTVEEEGKVPAEEEEVEEFYAILRRMKVVVKYFDDRGRGVREWREAIEKPDLTVVDDKKENGSGEILTAQPFDLNTVAPEAAESGGA